MQRFFALIALLLFSLPVGLSITGCTTKVDAYCNNAGFGAKLTAINAVSLSGGNTGISLAYGQISTAGTATATNCRGTTLSVGAPTYGSSNLSLADINPSTGSLCAGTWNRLSPGGIPDFTICTPPAQPGTAQITATIGGVSSNPVTVYVHPAISSITIPDPGACVSQNVVGSQPLTTGTQVFDTSGNLIPQQYIGTITYAAVTPSIVTINNTTATTATAAPNGTVTANMPGATVITATVSKVTSSAGYFYTCPPAGIGLTLDGGTSANVTAGNPQNIVATIPDTTGAFITGLSLDYTSTQPQEIAVSSTGAVSSTFAGAAAVTAICQPATCNPAPINKIGTYGTGLPVVSNRINVTSPGNDNTLLWAASPQSQFFTPFDLSLNTSGAPVHLPYIPNSMVLDQAGSYLYFGSYRELMVYSATTNGLTKEDTTVPGVVLAVSPDSSTVVINDQIRQVIYLYTAGSGGNISIGGLATRAVYSPDSKNVYIVGPTTLYVHNSSTGWSIYPLTSEPAPSPTCALYNPADPTNPNSLNNLNQDPFCSPDVAISVPAVAPFISGLPTTARSFCPNDATAQPPYYPLATTVAAQTDHLAVTNDGAHVIGATTTSVVDIEHSPSTDANLDVVPRGMCPHMSGVGVDPLSGPPLQFATSNNQLPLSGITATQIDQVLAAPNSEQVFITYSASAATGLLPLYVPSATPGAAGTLSNVQLASGAQAPIVGVFSPDIKTFFVSTTGDNLIHQLSTGTLVDGQTLNPLLRDANNNPAPAQFLVVKPRPTT
jgi:hypothetical protein